jgi:hypothetical protein
LQFTIVEEDNVLEIIRTSTTKDQVAYTLSGEITFDQIARLELLVGAARQHGKVVTLELAHVWRVDRDAAECLVRHTHGPDHSVRVRGLSTGLLEWLQAVAHEHSSENTNQ